MTLDEISRRLVEDGVAQVGYSFLEDVLPLRYQHLPYGITLVYKLSDAVVDEILSWQEPGPTFSYFQHYRAVNAFLDNRTLWVTAMLERMGYRAMPVAASQSVRDMGEYAGIFPHKTAAVRAGLGWIGKSALFVSPIFGPAPSLSRNPRRTCLDAEIAKNARPRAQHAPSLEKRMNRGSAGERIF